MRKKKKNPKKKNGLPRRFIWRLGIFERIEAIAIMTYSSFCFSKSSSLPLLLLGFVWTCSLVLTLLIRTVRTKIDNFFSFLKKRRHYIYSFRDGFSGRQTESNERGIYIHIKWVDHDVGKNRTGRTSYSFTPRSQNQFFWLNCHCVRIKNWEIAKW